MSDSPGTARGVTTPDVVVLGGGPAGTAAALGLARRGLSVALVTRPRPAAHHEGLSARTIQGLQALGLTRALAAIGPAVPRRVTWGGETRAAGAEHLVDRAVLDAALVEETVAAGVSLVRGRVGAARLDGGRWRIGGSQEDGAPFTLEGEFLVEARGREAPTTDRTERGLPTTALLKAWALPPGRPAGSAVATFPRGWAWFAAGDGGRATLQVVVASARGGLPTRAELEGFYAACLAELPESTEWLDGARPAGPVGARHATPVLAAPLCGDRLIRVGDAASAIDPLSGQGVFEAVGGALAAVAAVATVLARPADGRLAREFYAARVADAFRRHARMGRDHYAREGRWAGAPFWAARGAWPDDEPARVRPEPAGARILERPVVADGYVVRRPVVVTAQHPRGVWQVDGVPLVSLLEFLRDRPPAPAAPTIAAAAVSLGRPEARVAVAFDWLRAQGLVY